MHKFVVPQHVPRFSELLSQTILHFTIFCVEVQKQSTENVSWLITEGFLTTAPPSKAQIIRCF